MKIEFKRLVLHGFLSYLDADISLADNGFVFIQGINENPNDNAGSNGSGKSAIADSVAWVLTGETIRGTKDIVSHYSSDGAYVGIEMIIDGHPVSILRSKEHKQYKTSLQIVVDGNDVSGKGIRESEKILAQYLPDMTSSLIGSVILLGQGLPQKFTNNTPSGRKEVLEKLSKSDFMIEDLKQRVAKRKAELSSEMRKCEDSVLASKSSVSIYEKQLADTVAQLNQLGNEEQYDDIIKECESIISKIDSDMVVVNNSIAENNNSLSIKNDSLSLLLSNYNNQISDIDSKYREQQKDSMSNKTSIQAKIYALQSEITQKESVKDVCPTCGQKLPNVVKPDVSEQKAQLSKEIENLSRVEQELQNISKIITEEKSAISIRVQGDKNSINGEISKLQEQARILNTKLSSLNSSKLNESRKLQESVSLKNQLSDRKKYLTDNIKKCKDEIASLQDKILYINNERENINAHLEVVTKFETIIKRDFRGYLLNSVIEYIDKKSKEYSKDVFGTDSICFSLEGNNINISYDEKEYECLSGGEKQKVDIIIQFAIRDMLCMFLGFSSNILFLDEITDNLDYIGCQKIIDLITKKLTDISSVFIISHHSDISIPVDKEITVVKSRNGVSRIV